MAVELASAYVSIIPTTKGIEDNLAKELSPLTGAASKAGASSGKALGSSFSGASGGLKSSVADAEGSIGKFKSSATSALGSVGISAGALKVAGGAALIGFGVHAVGAFTSTAKSALDLSTSTGLAVEEASRWIAVGDDFEVSATALATGLGKVAKTLDDTKWAKYGIDTRDAGGHARSTNDILIDTFDKLSQVDNATEQARIGQELFGKGYQSLTPILGHTREEYEKMLGSVERGQVITKGEAAQAEKMRLAQDDLHDAIQDVTLALGGLFAKLAPVISLLAKGIGFLVSWTGSFIDMATGVDKGTAAYQKFFAEASKITTKQLGDAFRDMARSADESHNALDRLSFGAFKSDWDNLYETIKKMGKDSPESVKALYQEMAKLRAEADAGDPAAKALADQYEINGHHLEDIYDKFVKIAPAVSETDRETRKLTGSMGELDLSEQLATDAAGLFQLAAEDALRSAQYDVDKLQEKWDTLTGNLNNEKAWLNLKSQADDVKQANIDAATAIKEHGPGSPEAIASIEAARVKAIDLELATAAYAKDVAGLPPEVATKIAAEIGAGDIDKALADIQAGFDTHTFRINAHLDSIVADGETHAAGSFGLTSTPTVNYKLKAKGGYTDTAYNVINDEGPELVKLPIGSWVATAAAARSLMSGWASSAQTSPGEKNVPPIIVNNNRRDIGVADLNQILAMARLAS